MDLESKKLPSHGRGQATSYSRRLTRAGHISAKEELIRKVIDINFKKQSHFQRESSDR